MNDLVKSMPRTQTAALVPIGTRMASPGIKRVDVADGTIGRGIIITEQTLACLLHYSEVKDAAGYYYVTNQDILNYGLPANLYYVFLIARLNTDARGNILDDSFKVEYLRLKESSYEELADAVSEVGSFSLAFKKEVKGKFSNIVAQPSLKVRDDANHVKIMEKIKTLNVESLFKIVKRDLGKDLNAANLERLGLKNLANSIDAEADEFAMHSSATPTQPKKPPVAPKATFDEAVSFEEAVEVFPEKSKPTPTPDPEVKLNQPGAAAVDEFPDL